MRDRDRQVIFKLAEYAAIAATTAGIIISFVVNQSLYALIPLAIWLLIGFLYRQYLAQQVRRCYREISEVREHSDQLLPLTAQLSAPESVKTHTAPSQADIQQLQNTLVKLEADLHNSQEQQQDILRQESQYMSQITQLQEQVQQLAQNGVKSQDWTQGRSQLQQRLEQVEMALGIVPEVAPKSPELPFKKSSQSLENPGFSRSFGAKAEANSDEPLQGNAANLDDFLDIVDRDVEDEDLIEAELQKEAYRNNVPPR